VDGKSNVVIENLQISTTAGACVVIRNSQNVTLRNSEIGACKGNGVEISNSSAVRIVDNYIHPEVVVSSCCDKGDGIFAHTTSDLLIQGNVIAYGESNMELQGVSRVDVVGNFLVNPTGPFPRGQHVQVWARGTARSRDIRVEGNYLLSTSDAGYKFAESQQDAINFGYTDGAVVRGNYIYGGKSPSGCAIIADDSANGMNFLENILIETGQCAIGIASGTNHVVDGNRAFAHGISSGGNTAIYVWNQYSAPCGPVRVSNNIAVLIRLDGSYSSYWKGPGCDTTSLVANLWDNEARTMLAPVEYNYPAPTSLPPQPYLKKAVSPYSQ
jgi:hypothetical protein